MQEDIPKIGADDAALLRSGTALFVRRPILAFVLNALIFLAGLAGFQTVELRELPNPHPVSGFCEGGRIGAERHDQ